MKTLSPNTQYTVGIMVTMTLYVACLFGSILAIKHYHPAGIPLYGLAVLPALPVGGSIVVFLRYIDQVDEYVRSVILKRFVLSTGLTLFICTAWGFIEANGGGQHLDLYLVYPLFWLLFGFSCAIYRKV